jgi:hypothetical protein
MIVAISMTGLMFVLVAPPPKEGVIGPYCMDILVSVRIGCLQQTHRKFQETLHEIVRNISRLCCLLKECVNTLTRAG